MKIHPIEYRYGTPQMRRVFSREYRIAMMLKVEATLSQVEAELGLIPEEAAEIISKNASLDVIELSRIEELEEETKHNVAAVVYALEEKCGEYGRFIHFGATSNDILDTATALQFKEGLKLLETQIRELCTILAELARGYSRTLCVARTHGVHALPYILGLKFALWLDEFMRHLQRINESYNLCVGKISGAVGTYASFGEKGRLIELEVMKRLGLPPPVFSTQVVPRDLYAELISHLLLISCSCEKIATEIRNLHRTEIGEVMEGFGSRQVGSSTMPQKRNPILSERVCGIAKVLRGLIIPTLENIPLWHERDLTNSSSERVVFPEVFILLSEQLSLLRRILTSIVVDEEALKRNVNLTGGRIMAENLFLHLIRKGLGRREAHTLVSEISSRKGSFQENVLRDKALHKYLSEQEIKDILTPARYVGLAGEIIEEIIKRFHNLVSAT
ncbi:MAG TPA: adenylosuccinate lyase [Candidatus Bathyarchaeota archaeon]|nr:adenylosuccinate lyase [Candidatus Bathyarchaeota archaeon]